MEQSKIGQFMKEMRSEKGMTQAALAEQLNVSDKTISKWENGKSMPEPGLMLPLCDILHISVSELLNGQRIAPDEYHLKTEETMMDLVKETENNKKKEKRKMQGLWGGILLCFLLIVATKRIMPQSNWIGMFINTIDITIIIVIDAVVLLASGYGKDFIAGFRAGKLTKEELVRCKEALELLSKTNIYIGLFILVNALISILRLLEDPAMLGPQCSIAMLGLLYAFVFNMILLIPIYRLKKRITE